MTEANAIQDPNQGPEVEEVTDLDDFVKKLVTWHSHKVRIVEHFLQVPEGQEVQLDNEEPFILEGDAHKAFKMAIHLALSNLGKLPFNVEYESTEADAAAKPN
jgi:hypothetical protein